jgi:hypothetical protein
MNGVLLRHAGARAGAPGAIRFTERQLYYELCRVLQPLCRARRRPGFAVPAPVSYHRYETALRRWSGEVSGLLTGPRSPAPAPPAEVFDYGLPRVLVCQHREIADMLLANRLHMESACPVFAVDDLPLDDRLPDAVRRGDGRLYVLHDASFAGLAAVATVRRWADDLPLTPLGLRPAHAAALHLPRIRVPAANRPRTPCSSTPSNRGNCGGCGPGGWPRWPRSIPRGCCALCTGWCATRAARAARCPACADCRRLDS